MKLIDLLVRELPKRGRWPEGAVECQRFVNESNIDFYDENGNWDDDCLLTYGAIAAELVRKQVVSCEREQVTFDEYKSALASSDGWIEWGGGEFPVGTGVLVDIRIRNGKESHGVRANQSNPGANPDASYPFWRKDGAGGDIISYRLHKPEINSRANDDRLEQDLNECIGASEAQVWIGVGFPPAGCECELTCGIEMYTSRGTYEFGPGTKVKVGGCANFGYGDKAVVVVSGTNVICDVAPSFLCPLRTEAEKAREKLAASLHIAAGASPIELNGIGHLYFGLADAIISGSVFGTTFKADK